MQDPNVQLWCEDEVHFQRHTSFTRMWASQGQQPRHLTPSVRHKVAFLGALNLKSGQLLTQEAPTFSAQTFQDFAKHLLEVTRGKLCLILDNACWHHSQGLKEFFEKHRKRLVLLFLPAYSPELNPVERVWRITRRKVTHNRYFVSLAELRSSLMAQFSNWNLPNSILKVLCANI
jgi:transposase